MHASGRSQHATKTHIVGAVRKGHREGRENLRALKSVRVGQSTKAWILHGEARHSGLCTSLLLWHKTTAGLFLKERGKLGDVMSAASPPTCSYLNTFSVLGLNVSAAECMLATLESVSRTCGGR